MEDNHNILPSEILALVPVAIASQFAFIYVREGFAWLSVLVIALQFLVCQPFLIRDLFIVRARMWIKATKMTIFALLFLPSLLYELFR